MRPSRPRSNSVLLSPVVAPLLIAIGLAILFVHIAWPALPIAAAFAVIALGASLTTVEQFRRPAVIVGHVAVYASLYLLLAGAVYDEAVRNSESGLSTTYLIDLGISAGVMAFVIQWCVAALRDDQTTPAD